MIQFLSLTNFKCFKYLELDFAPLTLITGTNGAGKSTIIQSLLLLRQSHDWRYLSDGLASVNGELVNLVSGPDIRYKWEEKDSDVTIHVEFQNGDEASWILNSDARGDEIPVSTKELNAGFFEQNLFKYTFAYLYSERPGPRDGGYLVEGKFKHKGRLGTRFGELATALFFNVRSIEASLLIPELRHPDCQNDNIFQNVNAWLSYIFGNRIDLRPKKKSSNELDLEILISKNGILPMTIPAVNAAFGYSYLFPVVLGLLTAEPGSLFIVENPEAHLHPSAQTKIGKLLALAAQNGVQVIVETHSEHLLNGVRVLVKGEPGWDKIDPETVLVNYFDSRQTETGQMHHRQTIKIRENGSMEDWPIGFFDEWENNLMKLIS